MSEANTAEPLGHPDAASAAPAKASLLRRVTGSAWFHLFAAFVVMGLILTFVAKPYVVPSGSMEQTLQVGDRVLVNRLAYVAAEPQPGDIVVFDAGEAWDGQVERHEGPVKSFLRWVGEVTGFGPSGPHTLVKRVIAGPGQTVSCCSVNGHMLVDGAPVDEPYVFQDFAFEPGTLDCTSDPRSQRCLPEVTVPENAYLMLGDHRSASSDSAYLCRAPDASSPGCYRWAMREEIVGKVSAILWPIGRWQGL